MTLYGGFWWVIHLVGLIVWVVGFHEALPCPLLVGLHLLAGVAPHLLVGLDVAGDAQQLDVVDVVGQPLHLLFGLGRLDRHLVMTVNAGGDIWHTTLGNAVSLASLAKSASPLPHHPLYLMPSLVVQ